MLTRYYAFANAVKVFLIRSLLSGKVYRYGVRTGHTEFQEHTCDVSAFRFLTLPGHSLLLLQFLAQCCRIQMFIYSTASDLLHFMYNWPTFPLGTNLNLIIYDTTSFATVSNLFFFFRHIQSMTFPQAKIFVQNLFHSEITSVLPFDKINK